jgi:hypothetical protein
MMIGRTNHICDKNMNESTSTLQNNVSFTSGEEEKSDEFKDNMDSLSKPDILIILDDNLEIHRQLERTSSVQFLKTLNRVNTA